MAISSLSSRFIVLSASGGDEQKRLKLYSFFRSSCAHRVRIALKLKGLDYEYKAVNLLQGEHLSPEFTKLNPIGYVPVLVDEDIVVSDSFAILMYLEEKYPEHPLLPLDLQRRAINYQAVNIVSSSIQPLQNNGPLKYIAEKVNPDESLIWVRHHIGKGFAALEKLLQDYAGKYATGDEVYMVCLFYLCSSLYIHTKPHSVHVNICPLKYIFFFFFALFLGGVCVWRIILKSSTKGLQA